MNNKEKFQKSKNERLGQITLNKQGCLMEIIEYNGTKNISVEFENGFISYNKYYKDFKVGNIKNLYLPILENIGFIGEGIYNSKTKEYNLWSNLIKRCYNKTCLEKRLTYKGCIVCEEWHNFQNFAKWYNENLWDKNCTVLDKDILVKGNKIYNPETCVLVDNEINCLFTKRQNFRGQYPIGVYYKKGNKKFLSQCSFNNKVQRHLGYYNTPEEAFLAYKIFKESYIKQIANEYKSKYQNFPQKLYNAMYNYEVEITD